jgi:hypothetical protein
MHTEVGAANYSNQGKCIEAFHNDIKSILIEFLNDFLSECKMSGNGPALVVASQQVYFLRIYNLI